MKVSNRARNIPASPIRKLIPFADEAKQRGVHVYHLNIGQPDIETPPQMWERIRNYDTKVLAYGPSNGILEFRQALIPYYDSFDIDLTTDEMIITTGGSEALLFALMVTTNPGDEVIIPEPYYANYNGFANYAQVNIVPVTAKAEDGFRLPTKEEIAAKITPKTKAILFSNPGNPTGVVYTRQELQVIADLALEHSLFVVADEVYREFVYEGEFTSILNLPELSQHAILADSISKRFSACGARIGCLASKNEVVMDSALKYAQARLCPPTLEQIGAIGALQVSDDYFSEVLSEYQKRRDIVIGGIEAIDGALCQTPKGAFYCIAKLPVDDCEKFAKWMLTDFNLDNETTMVAPATGFYGTDGKGKDEVRIAYVLNEESLRKAMKVLALGVAAYRKHHKLDLPIAGE